MLWDFATATPTLLPHMGLGGAPVYGLCWNYSYQAVAACSLTHYAPIAVRCYSSTRPAIELNAPPADGARKSNQVAKVGVVSNAGDCQYTSIMYHSDEIMLLTVHKQPATYAFLIR